MLRESYQETLEDLRHYAAKVKSFNEVKKAIREYLSRLRAFKANVKASARERGIDFCSESKDHAAVVAELFEKHARTYEQSEIEQDICLPGRVPPAAVTDRARLEAEIARWEGRLASAGDDAQLANVDLQNILQKQQQTLQMLSNISKIVHDTAMSVIRKIGG